MTYVLARSAQACAFLAASTVPEVVRIKFGARWMRAHYARKFGTPLRCGGGASQGGVSQGGVAQGGATRPRPTSRLAASDFATPKVFFFFFITLKPIVE